MAGYQFKPSGIKLGGFRQDIDMYFEDDLFERAQKLIEDLAVATGHSPVLKPGRIDGVFAIAFTRDRDGHGVVGLEPLGIINADIINAEPAKD